ncbi:protein heat intolerant 4-related [Anaeramoeba ignava]|uniref:Protein heat intolerant 4-related n=1 Tax=Anaeramoeba ignava TaxID=1746090 RepID=A0A9Q0RE14_ANAIG|nr:protein heat intolerant 4-related [Anaeramoeba ignava]
MSFKYKKTRSKRNKPTREYKPKKKTKRQKRKIEEIFKSSESEEEKKREETSEEYSELSSEPEEIETLSEYEPESETETTTEIYEYFSDEPEEEKSKEKEEEKSEEKSKEKEKEKEEEKSNREIENEDLISQNQYIDSMIKKSQNKDPFTSTSVFFIGTEPNEYDSIFDHKWDFAHLKDQIFKSDGALYKKSVFLFGQTEPQQLQAGKNTFIPVIIAINIEYPPSETVKMESVQMKTEDRKEFTFQQLGIGWTTYKNYPNIHYLDIHRLRMNKFLKYSSEFTYCVPYIQEELLGRKPIIDRTVNAEFDYKGKKYQYQFQWDWYFSRDEKNNEIIADSLFDDIAKKLSLEKEDALKDKIFESAKFYKNETVERLKKERSIRQAKFAEIPQEKKDAFKSIKCYKFYPQNEPLIERWKSTFINRNYPKAIQIFPPKVVANRSPFKPIQTNMNNPDIWLKDL